MSTIRCHGERAPVTQQTDDIHQQGDSQPTAHDAKDDDGTTAKSVSNLSAWRHANIALWRAFTKKESEGTEYE